jgi:nicotinamidase-related amidase
MIVRVYADDHVEAIGSMSSQARPLAPAGEWRDAVPEHERAIYARAGFGRRSGLGSRPALLIIDVQYRTVGRAQLPIEESIEREYPTSCGEMGWRAVASISELLGAARSAGVPVMYPHVAPKAAVDAGRTGEKIPTLMEIDAAGYELVAEVAPEPGDVLIPKRHPSAFFATALVSYLVDAGVDTVLLTGCTTSGCVRATATDAFAYNFRCAVVEDCVYDRSVTSHRVNLFDIDSKYADVIPLADALAYVASCGRREDEPA